MMLFYFNPEQNNHRRLIEALYNSYPGRKNLFPTTSFARNQRFNTIADYIVFAGMIRGEGNIYKWCVSNNKRFFYVDHAYIDRGYRAGNSELEWMRITDSNFVWNKLERRSDDRWNRFFAARYPLEVWNKNKRKPNILILPPSSATKWLFPESATWLETTLKHASSYSDKNIVIREKPKQPLIDASNKVIGRVLESEETVRPIEMDLNDASLVVTYNSAVTVQAVVMGIPVISSPNSVASSVSIPWEVVNDPYEPPRKAWLDQLAYHQFKTAEMMDGTAWRMLLGAELDEIMTRKSSGPIITKTRKGYISNG